MLDEKITKSNSVFSNSNLSIFCFLFIKFNAYLLWAIEGWQQSENTLLNRNQRSLNSFNRKRIKTTVNTLKIGFATVKYILNLFNQYDEVF